MSDCDRCLSKQVLIDALFARLEWEEKRRLDMTKNYLALKAEHDALKAQLERK